MRPTRCWPRSGSLRSILRARFCQIRRDGGRGTTPRMGAIQRCWSCYPSAGSNGAGAATAGSWAAPGSSTQLAQDPCSSSAPCHPRPGASSRAIGTQAVSRGCSTSPPQPPRPPWTATRRRAPTATAPSRGRGSARDALRSTGGQRRTRTPLAGSAHQRRRRTRRCRPFLGGRQWPLSRSGSSQRSLRCSPPCSRTPGRSRPWSPASAGCCSSGGCRKDGARRRRRGLWRSGMSTAPRR
mmetsp:Transcript_63569/g.152069  ORF Transcript_63569/g.152069 Transcript_63569/m.152069 type:complete len:239 (+) Transcript_63569:428-1144(+)